MPSANIHPNMVAYFQELFGSSEVGDFWFHVWVRRGEEKRTIWCPIGGANGASPPGPLSFGQTGLSGPQEEGGTAEGADATCRVPTGGGEGTADELAELIAGLGPGWDVYAGIALASQAGGPLRRINNETAAGLVGLVADVDAAVSGQMSPKRRAPAAVVMQWVDGLAVQPTMTVWSGGGLHAYWLFREPWIFSDEAERLEAMMLSQAWGATLSQWAHAEGFDIDAVHDLARLLRVPETDNCKDPVTQQYTTDSSKWRRVELRTVSERRYNPQDFWQYIPESAIPTADSIVCPTGPQGEIADVGEALERLLGKDPQLMAIWKREKLMVASRCHRCDHRDSPLPHHCPVSNAAVNLPEECPRPGDPSASAYALALADRLASKYRWPREKLAGAVTEFYSRCARPGDHKLHAAKLWKTVDRAMARRQQQQPRPTADELAEASGVRAPQERTSGEGRTQATTRRRKEAPAGEQGKGSTRGIVTTGQQLRSLVVLALRALISANRPQKLFVRGGKLVRVCPDEVGRVRVEEHTTDSLRFRLAEVTNWMQRRKGGLTGCSPPTDVVNSVLTKGDWRLPALQGVIEHPVVRPDGQIVETEGYDEETRLLYIKRGDLTIPPLAADPTPAQAAEAAEAIWEVISEFPFADGSGMANTLALLLTPILRPAIAGPVPLCCITAPVAGTGKGLLAEVCSIIATGLAASPFAARTEEDDWEKLLFSQLLQGAAIQVIDNVTRPLRDPTLSLVLTTEWFTSRVLGRSEGRTVPNVQTWIATGNNLQVDGDMRRRCFWIRLNPLTYNPEGRTFLIADLKRFCRENRGRLLASLLTISRAWWAAGCPAAETPGAEPMGSFERWQETLSGVLANAGVTGFLANQAVMREEMDQELPVWRAFLTQWALLQEEPITTAKLIELCQENDELGECLPEWCIVKGAINPRTLGNALRARVDRRFDEAGLRIVRVGVSHGAARWQVVRGEGVVVATTLQLPGELEGSQFVNSPGS